MRKRNVRWQRARGPVAGLLSMVTCWMAEECTECAYLVDKNDVGLDGRQTVVNVLDEYGHTLMILRSVSHG